MVGTLTASIRRNMLLPRLSLFIWLTVCLTAVWMAHFFDHERDSDERQQAIHKHPHFVLSASEAEQLRQAKQTLAKKLSPQLVWLASYPNSGTSYTMTLVERATNVSTATNYGQEVTFPGSDSLSIYKTKHPEGPYWEGMSGKLGKIRPLPDHFILTKTHCGGRCIKCDASDYIVDKQQFLQACRNTTGKLGGNKISGQSILPSKLIHLIRNPVHNTVARFHMERRNLIEKNASLASLYPRNATGFAAYCQFLDTSFSGRDDLHDATIRRLFANIPCYAEFFKYVQWHNSVAELLDTPTLVLFYEDYETQLEAMAGRLFEFLNQTQVEALRPFRALPNYDDHFTNTQLEAIRQLTRAVANPSTWQLLQRYFS